MSIEKITITAIKGIEDTVGTYGPQKRIQFKDQNERWLSGWVPENKFDSTAWVVGKTIELDVEQKGRFWNFKVVGKKAQESQVQAQHTADEHKAVMEALRMVYSKLNGIEAMLEKVLDPQAFKLAPEPQELDINF